jgi:hypothetical protein
VTALVGGLESNIRNSTNKITAAFRSNYAIASQALTGILSDMKQLEASIQQLEKELELNKAPYTPGRWPEWK